MNNVIKENVAMDDYEILIKSFIELYNIKVNINENKPGYISSIISSIELDLSSIGISDNIILIPNDDNYNAKRGIIDLQCIINNNIKEYENMSFVSYIKYKKHNIMDDIVKNYIKWKEIKKFIDIRLKGIYNREIKEDKGDI